MTEFTYREGPREGPFYSVKGMVDYFSNGTASPKGSGPEFGNYPKIFETNEVETRDDCTKRVVFHPAIVSGESGEDLHFDQTKVHTPNHRQDSIDDERRDDRSILSKKKSVTSPRQNSNMTENEVYSGMSRRCRADLLRDHDSTNNNNSRRGRTMKNGQVKKTRQPKTFFAPAIPPPKNYLSVIQEAQTKSEATKKKGGLSPKKFSVTKIRKARSGPAPKSDDFYSELKQWHKDYSLRQVEKPLEITVITASKGENDVKEEKKLEEEKKADVKKGTKRAADDAKKALAEVNKELSKKKKLKKKMEKEVKKIAKNEAKDSVSKVIECTNDDGPINEMSIEQSGKKKKKFWKIPKIPGRRNKSKNKNKSKSTNQSTNDVSSTNSVEASTDSSLPSIPQKYPSLGLSEKPTKVPMKEPAFHDTLNKFLQLQSEMVEEKELSVVDKKSRASMSSEGTSTNESTNATHQRAGTNTIVVETVYSTEEEDSEASRPKIEPEEVKGHSQPKDTQTDQNESAPELEQSESWLEKAAGFFKKEEKEEPLLIVTKFDEDEVVKGRDPTPTNRAIEAEKEEEIGEEEGKEQPSPIKTAVDFKETDQTDPWIEKISGFFKKDKISGPPVKVVEVDKFDVDKYEAFAETEDADKDDCIESEKEVVDKSEVKAIENREQEAKSVRFTESTKEESLGEVEEHAAQRFMQSHCPCVTGQRQSNPVKESDQKGSSWLGLELGLGLASAYFMTKNETEVPIEDAETKEEIDEKEEDNEKDPSPTLASQDVEPLCTPKASNDQLGDFFSMRNTEQDKKSADYVEPIFSSQSGTFDGSVPSYKESNRSGSFETNQEGTFDDSLLRGLGTSKSSTFDDRLIKDDSFINNLLTKEDGTKVTKIEAEEGSKSSKIEPSGSKTKSLLDLEANRSSQSNAAEERQTESRSCVDSLTNRCIATESRSCADSGHKDDPPADESKSLCTSESHSKTSEALSRKSNKAAKPTDVIILRKKSKKSDVEKDFENCGLQANAKTRNTCISLGKQLEKPAISKAPKKKAKKKVAKNQMKMGATLFGRLEPSSDTKKQKKKGKHAQTLF